MNTQTKQPVRLECRNALYFKANDYSGDDLLLVKEYQHHPDGTIKKNLRQIHNFQKEVYIHKPGYRTYQQKRVWKPKREMDIYRSTEAKLPDTIKKALNMPLGHYMSMRQICRSPYVYGTDISTTSIIKKEYKDRWPNTVSDASVAVIDIETNVKSAAGEIIAISLTFKDKAVLATTKEFIGTLPLAEQRFFDLLDKLTPEVRRDRHCQVEFHIAETPALAVMHVFKRAHEWQPDFITGWNSMAFDIPRIINALEVEGYNPADVLSDPRVPRQYRTCQYRKGTTVKKMASGREQPLAGYEQWHWLNVPASFYFLDSMCLYFQIRKGEGLEENYKLETILQKHIGRGKVGIEEADHLDGIDLHRFMQERYKLEYLVYNLFDCIGVEMLDEKTKDIAKTFPVLAGVSDFGNYTSNPRRLADSLHFYVQEDKDFDGVLGTASDQLKTELDSFVVGLDGWIVALPTERLMDMGQYFLKELPNHQTKVHAHSSDIDVSSGYPNIERAMNMSKDTTVHEIHRIKGIPYEEQRFIGLNMLGGYSNSLSFAKKVYRLPYPRDVWKTWLAINNGGNDENRYVETN